MAAKSEDRYASVSALADDVERWLADEPMIACGDPGQLRSCVGCGSIARRSRQWLPPWSWAGGPGCRLLEGLAEQ